MKKLQLITGANGFIGSNLLQKLKNPISCDVSSENMLSPELALDAINSGEVSEVYHLGAISATTETSLTKVSKHNVLFSSQLLDACIRKDIPFVYASSASVYGLGESGFSEKSRLKPLNYYAISKAVFDMFAERKMLDYPTAKITGLRYFNVYGHNEDHKTDMASPVHKFLEQSRTGKIKVFEGSEKFVRDFVHVSDVVSITKAAVNFPAGIYNVGSGVARSFIDVAKIISSLTSADIEEIPFPEHLVGKYQEFTCSDNDNINKVYPHKRLSIEDGIRKVYEDRVY